MTNEKTKPDMVSLSEQRGFARAFGRAMAGVPYSGHGVLNDWRAFDRGTRGELNAEDFAPESLGHRISVRLSLDVEVPSAASTRLAQVIVHEISFRDFWSDVAAPRRIMDALRAGLPKRGSWGLRIELVVDPVTTDILPRPAHIKLVIFPAGRDLSETDVGDGAHTAWKMLQSDLWHELAFRRRFRVASERAYHFYCQLAAEPGPMAEPDPPPFNLLGLDYEKIRYDMLVKHYRLRLPSEPDALMQQGTGYLNLALHVLRKGNGGLASDLFMTALANFQHPTESWTTGTSTTHRTCYDLQAAMAALGRRERTLLRLLLKQEDVWRASERRRRMANTKHSLVSEEGLACWREITELRMCADGRVMSADPGGERDPEEVRRHYLSKHESNPYRRGLELYEAFAVKIGESLAWGPVPEAILLYPAINLRACMPPSLNQQTTPGTWYAPDTRLSKLANASVPATNDIEEILRALHQQVDGDSPGIRRLCATAFRYSLAALCGSMNELEREWKR